jgi:hypothetical protein
MILAKSMGAALAVAVMAGFAGEASAGLREYCDSYARDVAHRKANGGADGLVGVGGTILGAGVTSDRYKRAYTNAFERCIDNYEGQRASDEAAEKKVAKTKVTEVVENKVTESEVAEKAEASAASRDKACQRKYRSYDPQKGKYKSYSGTWRPCRL